MYRVAFLLHFLLFSTVAYAQGLSPAESLQRMKPADGLKVQLVAAEPLIRQPVTMTFDSQGRLWVIQYLQYPTPAGLKPVEVDQYLRTRYDRVPEPPPHGPRGLDRVSILFDRDKEGRFQQAKEFVTGLNLASGLALGNEGAYVLQAPYLLFYPDRNKDDIPDGNPEVLLKGFGLEDAHAVGNSLVFGPDGWLYGAQGSTVTARIADPLTGKVVEFQQGIWRYHPRTRQFELFAEGGGNTWGLDFDRNGQLIAGTNWSNVAALHMVQGGYYVKGFSKHGPLHHPHAYGYFEHMPCEGFRGGHVTCGGIVYQGNLLADGFKNMYLGCNLLDHNLYWYSFQRNGSTFNMKHEGTLLHGNDTWFRPIDLLTGPDGAVYVCDWHDKRANHVDPIDNWDKSNGRIYKLVSSQDSQTKPATIDLTNASATELIALLNHPNSWQRSEARRLLIEKQDTEIRRQLKESLTSHYADFSLDTLWALYGCKGLDIPLTAKLLSHTRDDVRCWVIRMITDHATPEGMKQWIPVLPTLATVAEIETSPLVLSQLASTLRRLVQSKTEKAVCISLLQSLLNNKYWNDDNHGPLLLWWAIEEILSQSNLQFDCSLFGVQKDSTTPNIELKRFLLERISRRFMSAETQAGYLSQARLLEYCSSHPAPNSWLNSVLKGMETELSAKPLKNMPADLQRALKPFPADNAVLRIQLLAGEPSAIRWAHGKLIEENTNESEKALLLQCLIKQSRIAPVLDLQKLFSSAKTDPYRLVLLEAVALVPTADNIQFLIRQYTNCSSTVRRRIISLLISRPATSVSLCEAIEHQQISSKEIQLDQVQQMRRYQNVTVDRIITKYWGSVKPVTSGDKQARIRSIVHMLNQGQGTPDMGKALFTQHCATCHQLFGEGGKVGPDLTGADRSNREFLATHIIDPHLVIRPEYSAYTVVTTDGRTLTGLITEETTQEIKLLDAQANTIQLTRDRIDSLSASRQSLMPESILDPLDDQQIRHLFAYLQQPDSKSARKPAHELLNSIPLQAHPAFDFADKMVTGIDRMLDRLTQESISRRVSLWKRDNNSFETLVKSVEPNRQRLKSILGVVEERPHKSNSDYPIWPTVSLLLGQNEYYQVFIVRWRAFGNVEAEGLLLLPTGKCVADVIALPDADQTPEQLIGLVPGLPLHQQTARILAEQGCRVLIPVLIDRADTYSGIPGIRMTNQPHREWIYRQAYEMGRHIIGYEILKVQAGIDWFQSTPTASRPLGVIGYAEGGLIAFHTGAIDTRINVTAVDGYFGVRENLWQEPIYRNVWRQLTEFGDAEISQLFPPRQLILGIDNPPKIIGPPASRAGRSGAAPGKLETTQYKAEWKRLEPFRLKYSTAIQLDEQSGSTIHSRFFQALTGQPFQVSKERIITLTAALPDYSERMKRQVESLSNHIQELRRKSEAYRDKHFWAKLNPSSLDNYLASVAPFRQQFEHEVIGKIDLPLSANKARSRLINEQPGYVTYEVEMDVIAPDLIAYGWLLVPRNIKPGERRPVVVCQHGLEGRPADLADPKIDHPAYHRYACKLAERGFIVFAPQNPYLFGDRFRLLQRKANPLGLSLFSFIVAQHRQITEWLASLRMVDPDRIGFYGLSYGGKTAMRVPALVPRYCLSICSADFNEWIWKNTSIDNRYTYMTTNEWEMVEWNLGHTFNYAEMAALIAPRPFMVERGHRDGVAPDEQVAYEYAKVRRHYAELKIPDRTAIEFFDGPHTIHGQGTFEFLHRHLKWPEPK